MSVSHEEVLTTELDALGDIVDAYHTSKEKLRKEFVTSFEKAMDTVRDSINSHPDLEEDERVFLERLTHRGLLYITRHFPYDKAEWDMAHRLARYLRIEDIVGNAFGKHVSLKARPKTW